MDDHDLSPDETPARRAVTDQPGATDRRGRRSSRRLPVVVAVAAAVVSVAVIGGVWTGASGDDSVDRPGVVSSGPGGANRVWGARWVVSRARIDGQDKELLRSQRGEPLTLNFATEGRVGFNGCNGGGSDAHLVGDRLMVDVIVATRMACTDANGQALMDQDAWMAKLLEADPTVAIKRDTLTLSTETAVLTATRLRLAVPGN